MSGAHHGGKGDADTRTDPRQYRERFPLGARCVDCSEYGKRCTDRAPQAKTCAAFIEEVYSIT